ncbi:hypothetical protein EGT74_11650 [Chitinophaga lutea]|uniref:GIY-YIG domain-containing protein n=1 Tax=Chitinophaga lutea TaxID=2488634 RepID=A0A3N4QDU8_9BACT|nr:hypothetical protein EGT74_11650 [Chitinophaga lutea]
MACKRSAVRTRYPPQNSALTVTGKGFLFVKPARMSIFYVYILYSFGSNKYYIGHTGNLEKRLEISRPPYRATFLRKAGNPPSFSLHPEKNILP